MQPTTLFQIIQLIYWLALSTWFGGVLFVAIAAPVIFRSVRDSNPILPNVLSVNLENQHGTLLAGTIVGNILSQLSLVQLGCAIALALMMIAQVFTIDHSGTNFEAAFLRAGLLLAAAGFAAYDRYVLWPRILKFRDEYIAHADEPDIANPAKDRFDAEHQHSVNIMLIILCLLAGLILFSAAITPKPVNIPIPSTK